VIDSIKELLQVYLYDPSLAASHISLCLAYRLMGFAIRKFRVSSID